MIQDTQSLLTLLLMIGVLLWIMRWAAAPIRGGKTDGKRGPYFYRSRSDLRILRQYGLEHHFFGPLVVAMLLLTSTLADAPDLAFVCILVGACLGAANRVEGLWTAALVTMAVVGIVIQLVEVFRFVFEPHDAYGVAILLKASALVVICACFVLGAAFSLAWNRKVTHRALCFIVVLELVMVLAEPAFHVALHSHPLAVLTWLGVACALAGGLGLMSFPITLDLLAVALGVALWSSAAGDEPWSVAAAPVGVLAGFGARCLVGCATRG